MSAGQPNYQKLLDMGKLPKNMRGKVPVLAQLDAAEAVIEEIRKGCCDDCRAKFFPREKAAKEVRKKMKQMRAESRVLIKETAESEDKSKEEKEESETKP